MVWKSLGNGGPLQNVSIGFSMPEGKNNELQNFFHKEKCVYKIFNFQELCLCFACCRCQIKIYILNEVCSISNTCVRAFNKRSDVSNTCIAFLSKFCVDLHIFSGR